MEHKIKTKCLTSLFVACIFTITFALWGETSVQAAFSFSTGSGAYVVVPHSSSLNVTNITVECWFNCIAQPSNGDGWNSLVSTEPLDTTFSGWDLRFHDLNPHGDIQINPAADTAIGTKMGVQDRDRIKIDFLRVVNASEKKPDWLKKQYVFNFFANEFPIFTKSVLSVRTDLAIVLQNYEADLMIQRLGFCCKKDGLFWIPQHDGWISTEHDNNQIKEHASKIILDEIGFTTDLTTKSLCNPTLN